MTDQTNDDDWVLEKSGEVKPGSSLPGALHLDPDTHGPGDVPLGINRPVLITFDSFANGRGFSLARQLRERHGPSLRIVAQGHLLPDQARHAFQSGFDEILISDNALNAYGAHAWDTALQTAVGALYLGEVSGGGIWNRRHGHELT
ncbi:MAG: DUF934 domain-containing protein [Cohaesibacteraceae bacterium]